MKTKRFLLPAFCIMCIHVNAQTKDKAGVLDHEVNIYNNAIKFSDYEAAKNAVYALIEKYPDNNSWLDTLTRLYYSIGANNQTVMAGNACLKKDTSDKDLMEMVAIANSNLKHYQEALDMYKRLFLRTQSPYFAYQLAYNEYHLNSYEDACKTLEGIFKDTASESKQINITMDQNRSQKVPLKAAAYNLLGVVHLDIKQNDKAKNNFDEALKLYPDFQLAKENAAIAGKTKEGAANPVPAPREKK